VYVRATENGLSLFDMPARTTAADRSQWKQLLDWVKPYFVSDQAPATEKSASQLTALVRPFASGANAQPAARSATQLTQRMQAPHLLNETRHAQGSLPGWLMTLLGKKTRPTL
jgi:hypothetical protein